jgi:hypothetical protein
MKAREQLTLSQIMEQAMSRALTECLEKGILDPAEQRAVMRAAREQVKAALQGSHGE